MGKYDDPGAVRWGKSQDGFVESHDGEWFIEPTPPDGFKLRRKTEHGLGDGTWFSSQRKAKAHAQAVHLRELLAKEGA